MAIYPAILERSGTIAILIEDLSEAQSYYVARHGSKGARIYHSFTTHKTHGVWQNLRPLKMMSCCLLSVVVVICVQQIPGFAEQTRVCTVCSAVTAALPAINSRLPSPVNQSQKS